MARVDFNGLHDMFDRITLLGDDSIEYTRGAHGTTLWGAPVKITGPGTVGLAESGDEIYGFLHGVEKDGIAIVGKGRIQIARAFAANGDPVSLTDFGDQVTTGAANSIAVGGGSGLLLAPAEDYGAGYYYVDLSVKIPAAP